jgi:hypothetical protein
MLSALVSEFPDAEIYAINDSDLLILAPKTKVARPFQDAPWREEPLAAELRRVKLGSMDEITLRRIGGSEVIRQYVRLFEAPIHSDYYPSVSLNAPRTRFKNQSAEFLLNLVINGLPVLDILDCRVPLGAKSQTVTNFSSGASFRHFQALQVIDAIQQGHIGDALKRNMLNTQSLSYALSVTQQTTSLDTPEQRQKWSAAISVLAENSIGALPAEDLRDIWKTEPAWLPAKVARAPLAAALMRVYAASAARDPTAMQEEAEAVLTRPDANHLAPETREHLLVIAMLGALGRGDYQKAIAIDQKYHGNIAVRFVPIRSYLLAWADSGAPVCATHK